MSYLLAVCLFVELIIAVLTAACIVHGLRTLKTSDNFRDRFDVQTALPFWVVIFFGSSSAFIVGLYLVAS